MSCPVLLDPSCIIGTVVGKAAGAAAGTAASDALSGIASAIQSGVAWIVSDSVSWWVQLPSPDLAGEPAVTALQQWMLPVTAAVAVFGMLVAAAKMALTRRANPLADIGSGLVTIAATSAVGVVLPTLLLRAGDAWSDWVLNESTGGQFGARLTRMLSMTGVSAPAVVLILGIVAIVISAIQAMLMLFRQGALVVLAGVMPLSAAGTLTPATRPWFHKTTGWMLALIFYKPAAAAVYATAFTLTGTGKDVRTTLTGFTMVILSLAALPVLMRFFTWTTGAVTESAGGGGMLQTALGGAIAIGALRGSAGGPGGTSASEQARQTSAQLGPQGGPAGARPPAAGAWQGGNSAPGPAASPSMSAAPAGAAAASAGAGAGTGAAPGAAAAASSAGAGPAAAGAAGGPAGMAAAGLAAGAASARRRATEAMGPPDDGRRSQW
jgi:hypothetical protein